MGRTKFRLCETGVDAVVIAVGALGRQPLADAEQRIEHVIEPDAGRRAAKQMKVIAKNLPDAPMIRFNFTAIDSGNTQILKRLSNSLNWARRRAAGEVGPPQRSSRADWPARWLGLRDVTERRNGPQTRANGAGSHDKREKA